MVEREREIWVIWRERYTNSDILRDRWRGI